MGFLPNLSHFFPDLITVSLSNNHLTFIPQGCFQALPYLGLLKLGNNTNLTPWTFPDLIQSTKIQELNLVATNVMGSLPEIFDSLTSLETLLLSNNSLTGVLPESFGRSKITTLHLNDQKGKGFSGTMDVVSNMIDLSEAWLQGNSFDGYILDMSRCTALQDLRLAHNRFTGVVPDSLINLSRKNLQTVILNNNFFQGPMPNILGDSDSTNVGDNTTNAFCRDDYDPCDERVTILLEIASAFGYPYLLARSWRGNNPCHNWSFVACTATMITTVNLTRQNLTGTISDAFGKLTHLENLYLSGNNLNGSIPENFTSLHQLKNLDVSNNNLSGKIPNFSRGVYLNTEGNPSFERRKPSGKRRNPPAWIKGAIAAAAGIGGLVFLDLEEQNILGRGLSTTEEESDMIKKITLVSLWCIQTNPSDRPSINKAVEMLEGPLQSVPYPPKPVLYSPQMSISQFSRISYNSTYEEDSEIVEETISINKMSSKFAK
ncbi:hypothetical protein Ahy_A04g017124 [Arachis hypogaea]|uniref:Leucine-rich repeat-containing N-terminal plant-type domain-containing protein n=1 Tax=Arachis hypogaea TaxID=3818 RepID=A0A445DA21_ARAHY|nr:hypothetical protein Ahy_A04g017124 [Arachis hypogaea]